MSTSHQRHQLLESINGLDAEQTEQVLAYIRNLVHQPVTESQHEKIKKAALKEIRRALSLTRHMRPAL